MLQPYWYWSLWTWWLCCSYSHILDDKSTKVQIIRAWWWLISEQHVEDNWDQTCKAASPSPTNLSLFNLSSISVVSFESFPGKNTCMISLRFHFLLDFEGNSRFQGLVHNWKLHCNLNAKWWWQGVWGWVETFPSLPSFWLLANICQSEELKFETCISATEGLGGRQHCRLNICRYICWLDKYKYSICRFNQCIYKYWGGSREAEG